MTARRCAACGANRAAPHFRGLVACRRCGLVYYPRPLSPGEVGELYGEGYFHGSEYYRYLDDRPVHAANFRARVNDLARWLPDGSRLYEIGCAYGLFLNEARGRWRVGGCDVSPGPVRFARGELRLDADLGDFRQLDPGELDAVCLWDTIEHLDDPADTLAVAARRVRPGGLLALTTGDIGSWLARWQGERWRQIHPPTHLWYFNRSTMKRMLNRIGFEILDVRAVGVWRSLGQIVAGLFGERGPGTDRPSWSRIGVWLNTFDLMRVIARRSGRPAIRPASRDKRPTRLSSRC